MRHSRLQCLQYQFAAHAATQQSFFTAAHVVTGIISHVRLIQLQLHDYSTPMRCRDSDAHVFRIKKLTVKRERMREEHGVATYIYDSDANIMPHSRRDDTYTTIA